MFRRSGKIVAPLLAVLFALLVGLLATGARAGVETPAVPAALPGRPVHACNACV